MKKNTSKLVYNGAVPLYIDGEYYGDIEQIEALVESESIYSMAYSSPVSHLAIKTTYKIKIVNKPDITAEQFTIQKGLGKPTKVFINSKQDNFIPNKEKFYYVLPFYSKSKYSAKEYKAACDKYWEFKTKIAEVKKTYVTGGKMTGKTLAASGFSHMDPAVKKLPALEEKVKHPTTGLQGRLQDVIIQLNDVQKWTREQIADWLETLDIDIRFK